MKIKSLDHSARSRLGETELDILQHISQCNRRHKGWNFVQRLLDSFSVQGVSGHHVCLVFEALREPLWIYRERFLRDVIPSEVLKIMLQMILHGLDYLHSECHVVHAGKVAPNCKPAGPINGCARSQT
jgi:serine/threonine-protein kinase SRPK3